MIRTRKEQRDRQPGRQTPHVPPSTEPWVVPEPSLLLGSGQHWVRNVTPLAWQVNGRILGACIPRNPWSPDSSSVKQGRLLMNKKAKGTGCICHGWGGATDVPSLQTRPWLWAESRCPAASTSPGFGSSRLKVADTVPEGTFQNLPSMSGLYGLSGSGDAFPGCMLTLLTATGRHMRRGSHETSHHLTPRSSW